MKKIAILGGSFNPIHRGHIMLAEKAYTQFLLDEVWIMPNSGVYYKTAISTTNETRNDMIELAIKDYPYMKLSKIEQDRGGVTYTIDTMNYLHKEYSSDKFYFIIGGDSLVNLPTWREAASLINSTSIIAAVRDDVDTVMVKELISKYKDTYEAADISLLVTSNIEVSSSYIRNNFYEDENVKEQLPKAVYDYILNNELYKA